jgi:hypothetical protein
LHLSQSPRTSEPSCLPPIIPPSHSSSPLVAELSSNHSWPSFLESTFLSDELTLLLTQTPVTPALASTATCDDPTCSNKVHIVQDWQVQDPRGLMEQVRDFLQKWEGDWHQQYAQCVQILQWASGTEALQDFDSVRERCQQFEEACNAGADLMLRCSNNSFSINALITAKGLWTDRFSPSTYNYTHSHIMSKVESICTRLRLLSMFYTILTNGPQIHPSVSLR